MAAFVAAAVLGAVAAGSTFTIAAGLTLGFSWGAFASSLVLGGLSKAFTKKPSAPSSAITAQGQLITAREPIAPWQVIIGERRVGGTITFMEVTSVGQGVNNFLHMVITLAGHVSEEIVDIYFDDEIIPLDANGDATGRWLNTGPEGGTYVHIDKSLGGEAGQPFPVLVAHSAGKWTDAHRQSGRTKLYVRLSANQDLFPRGIPNITALLRGLKVYDPRSASTGWHHNPALATSAYLTHTGFGLGAVYADEINETALIAAANEDEERVAFAPAFANFTASPTTDALTMEAGARLPNTGDGVQVSSTGTLPAGLAAATTYYARRYAGGTFQLATSYANALVGTVINMTDAGTGTHILTYFDEPRYTANGAFSTSETPKAVLETLLPAMAGRAVNVGGKWHLYAGAYEAPTVTLDESDLAGPIRVQSLVSRRENANGVKGIFVDPSNAWQPTDFPPIASSAYLAEDNDERVWRDIDLSGFTTSGAMAQRLAKIELLRTRQGLTVSAPFKLTAFRVMAGGTVALDNTKFGWSGKAFDVVGSRFALTPAGELGVELDLRETASAVYDWTTDEEQAVDVAPNTGLPTGLTINPPGAPLVTESLYETRDGAGVRVKVTINWVAAPDSFVHEYQAEYKLAGASVYTELPRVRGLTTEVLDIAPGVYDFRVKAISTLLVSSAYSPVTTKDVQGLAGTPADVAGLTLQAVGGLAVLRWTLHPDLDVRVGGKIIFRHSETTSGAVWQEAFTIGEAAPGNANFAVLPLKAGSYLAKAEDSSGILSATAAAVSTKQASVLTFSTLNTAQEDAAFSGTHSGTIAIDGGLKLLGSGNFDAIADFDAIASLDDAGGVGASGTYTFAAGIDLTTVKRVRVTSKLEGVIVNVNDLIDARTDNIDDWVDFDGTLGADADAYVEMRETDDDPAGAPTWSAWKRLDADEHECRGLQFRAQLATNDPAYNVHIDVLRATVAEVV